MYILTYYFVVFMIFQGENGDLKNRGLKVEINHIPLGSCKPNTNSTNNMVDNFPDSSIGEGMDITIQGANGHVKHNNDNQSLKSQDSRQSLAPPPVVGGNNSSAVTTNGTAAGANGDSKLNKYSDMSIGLGMDISIRGDGEATTKDVPVTDSSFSRHNSLQQFDTEKEVFDSAADCNNAETTGGSRQANGNAAPDEDILSHTEIKHVREVLMDPVDDVVVEECCPEVCYRVCPCCIGDPDSPFWQLWYRHRLQVSR